MKIYINGVDMGGYCIVRSAEMHEYSHGRMDALDVTFEYAADWHRWQIEPDTPMRMTHDGYDTGEMYVRYLLPEGNTYRIIATAGKCAVNRKSNESYKGLTLGELIRLTAVQAGMESAVYGMDASQKYPYLVRRNMSAVAFLSEIVKREGGALKAVNGKLTAISYEYASALQPTQCAEITDHASGVSYEKRDADKLKRLTVMNGNISVYAEDDAVPHGNEERILLLPAADSLTAGRWARALIKYINRECEKVTIRGEFNAGFTAMARIDLTGGTDAAGKWLIEECTHDFVNGRSGAVLVRAEETE